MSVTNPQSEGAAKMMTLETLSDAELRVEHEVRREQHSDAYAIVECECWRDDGGTEAAASEHRDAAFAKCGETAAMLRARGYILRHDDSAARHPSESPREGW